MAFAAFLPLVGTALSGALGFASQSKTNADQMKLAEYQYSKNLEMWNRYNEYNTPSAQRERMEAAGFNPNLVYGHGSVVNTSSSAPQYSAPTLQSYTQFGNLGESLLDGILAMRKNIADVRKTEAEAKRAETLARVDAVDADNAEEFGRDSAKAELDDKIFTAQLKQYKSQLESARAFYADELAHSENLKNQVDVDLIIAKKNQVEKQIDNLDSLIELNKSSKDLNIAKTGLTNAQTVTEGYRPGQIVVQNALGASQIDLNRVLKDLRVQEVKEQKMDNSLKLMRVKLAPYVLPKEWSKLEAEVRLINQQISRIASQTNVSNQELEKLYYDTVVSRVDSEFAEMMRSLGFIGTFVNLFK